MNPPPQLPQAIDPKVVAEKINEAQQKLEQTTNALVSVVDAEYAFQALVTYHLFKVSKGYNEAEHGSVPALIELAAFCLYPRFGQGGTREPGQIQAIINALTEQNQFRGLSTAFGVDSSDRELASIQVHLRLYTESVRGTSYPPQTRRRIEQIQGPFESWFQAKVGVGPLRAIAILGAFEHALNENFQKHSEKFQEVLSKIRGLGFASKKKTIETFEPQESESQRKVIGEEFARLNEEMPMACPVSFDQIAGHVPNFTREEWEAFRELIGLTPDSRRKIQAPHEIKDRPVYFLSGNRFILFDISSVYDALFEAYDRVTRTDLPFRDKNYVQNLSRWMESETCEYLLRLFPQAAVYRQLLYPDPDNTGGEAELDAAVVWGPFLILVEVKGKQFRPRSRIGDPSRLRTDLQDSIEEAFEQAQRATRFIEANPEATFKEKGTDRKLVIKKETIRRIFPVSITLHHFGGLATQLALLKRIGLFNDSAYPWSVSLADLDIVTKFAGTPDVFLHYIQRRLDLQRSEKNIMGDELDVFGLYLDTRLHPSQFWERKPQDGQEFTLLHLSGGSERFDEWFQAEQGVREERPDIRLKLPSKFLAIIEELRQRDDNGARWVAFALLGLSQDTVSRIENDIDNVRRHARADGRLLRVTINDGTVACSIVAARGLTADELRRHTAYRATIEKYRLKTTASIALGINADDTSKPFDCAVWLEGPWVTDPFWEEALEKERPKALPGQKLPGRNDPCSCGSGKKFKKCCLGKISVMPKNN